MGAILIGALVVALTYPKSIRKSASSSAPSIWKTCLTVFTAALAAGFIGSILAPMTAYELRKVPDELELIFSVIVKSTIFILAWGFIVSITVITCKVTKVSAPKGAISILALQPSSVLFALMIASWMYGQPI